MTEHTRPVLLVVHHTASPALHTLLEAVVEGGHAVDGVEVVTEPALGCTASDVLAADAVVLGTPANLGAVSGALKHFFDTVYYPCLDATVGRPYGLYVHGNDDVTGAVRDVERIVTGLRWRQAHDHVRVIGAPDAAARAACTDLAGTLAAYAAGLV